LQFLKTKYTNTEIVFITCHTEAKEVTENQFFSLGETLAGGNANIDDFGAVSERSGALDGGSVRGHDDDSFSADCTGRVGNALGVVAAGVGNHAARNFFRRELQDFVRCAAEFKATDGLEAFALEPDFTGDTGKVCADERSFDGNAGDAIGGSAEFKRVRDSIRQEDPAETTPTPSRTRNTLHIT